MDIIDVQIQFESLKLLDEPAQNARYNPYLWTIFLKIDGSTITIGKAFRLEGTASFHFTEGSHGNLGILDLSSSKTIQIPPAIGFWQSDLQPLMVPYFEQGASASLIAIAVLMEQNNLSYEGAEAAHEALNKAIEEAINQSLSEFDPKEIDLQNLDESIKEYFEKSIEKKVADIEDKVVDAVKGKQNLLQNIWTLIKKDTLIGFESFDFSADEIRAAEKSISFKHRWLTEKSGNWEIKGKVKQVLSKKGVKS